MKDCELYINYLKNEIYFCEKALKNIDIIATNRDCQAVELFYHANVLFNSLANISKIIDNQTNPTTQQRSNELRKILGIRSKKIAVLSNRQYRNSNEHFDERIDSLFLGNTDELPLCMDFSVFDVVNVSKFSIFGRIYISLEDTFYFINDKIATEKLPLEKIRVAVKYLDECVVKYQGLNNTEGKN